MMNEEEQLIKELVDGGIDPDDARRLAFGMIHTKPNVSADVERKIDELIERWEAATGDEERAIAFRALQGFTQKGGGA